MSVHDRKNLKSALESAILYLQKQGVEEARQDAWLLLECLRDQPQHLLCTQ